MNNLSGAQPVHGKECRVNFDGSWVDFDTWKAQGSADTVPAYGFEDFDPTTGRLYKGDLAGAIQLTITASGFWDANNNPEANPPDLVEGERITNSILVVRRTGARQFTLPELLIKDVTMDGSVTKRVDINVTMISQGAYVRPT